MSSFPIPVSLNVLAPDVCNKTNHHCSVVTYITNMLVGNNYPWFTVAKGKSTHGCIHIWTIYSVGIHGQCIAHGSPGGKVVLLLGNYIAHGLYGMFGLSSVC